ncbi:hypothetical protein D3C87_1583320 [compost metagenome]
MVGKDEGLLVAVELRFDRLQDFPVERVHDVVHDDADDAGARRPEAGGTAVVDITEGAGLFLDLVACEGRHQRAVTQCEGYCCSRKTECFRDRRKLDLLRHDAPCLSLVAYPQF